MRLTVNGVEHELRSPPLASLLHALREELEITSPKAGCQQGGCGACTVLVDGEPRRSCLLPLAAVDGAHVTTVEGLGTPTSRCWQRTRSATRASPSRRSRRSIRRRPARPST